MGYISQLRTTLTGIFHGGKERKQASYKIWALVTHRVPGKEIFIMSWKCLWCRDAARLETFGTLPRPEGKMLLKNYPLETHECPPDREKGAIE